MRFHHFPSSGLVLSEIESAGAALWKRSSIGSAIAAIPAGHYVHTHNMKSDYIATFTFEKGKQFEEGKA